jgi:hypothetical protein
MKIIKEDIGFTQVGNSILYDKSISLKAKGLYAYLYSKPKGWSFSSLRIMQECADGRDSIRAGLKELEALGVLTRRKKGDGTVEYSIKRAVDNPVDNSNNSTISRDGKAVSGVPKDGKTHRRKSRPISNTDINNINIIYRGKKNKNEIILDSIEKKSWGELPEILEKYQEAGLSLDEVKNTLMRFWLYWTESDSKGKPRWKKETTFDVNRRIFTWFDRKKDYQKQKGKNIRGL